MDQNLYKKMMDQMEPDSVLVRKTRERMEEKVFGKVSPMRRSLRTVSIAALFILMFSTTAFAAWHFLKPADVAKEFENHALSAAFDSKTAININQSVTSGDYIFTLLAVVSGSDISDTPYDSEGIQDGRTYALVAFQNADGRPWPSFSDEAYSQDSFLATPLVKGLKPWAANAVTMNGGSTEMVKDGVLYRIVECDNVMMFADRGLYFAVCSDPFINNRTFRYDEETGEISVNPEFEGASALFDLPIDPAQADPQKAKAYLAELLDEEGNLKGGGENDLKGGGKNDMGDAGQSSAFLTKGSGIDWSNAEPVASTIRQIQPDKNGDLSYSYDLEDGGGTLDFPFSEYFTESAEPQSAIIWESMDEGKDGITHIAIRIDKDKKGKLTGMVLRKKER